MGSGGLLSSVSSVRRQQLSRINNYVQGKRDDAKKTRALRKARYQHKQKLAKLPKGISPPRVLVLLIANLCSEAREAVTTNPLQHGTPRCFKVLIAGHDVVKEAKLHDLERYSDEGHFIHFASFGIPGKAIRFNK